MDGVLDSAVVDAQGWTAETRAQWLAYLGHRRSRGNVLVICLRETEEVLGTVSLDQSQGKPVVGLILGPAGRGRGLGQEALRGALPSFQERGVKEVFLETAEDNAAMRRVAEAAGFELRDAYTHLLPNGQTTPAVRYSIAFE